MIRIYKHAPKVISIHVPREGDDVSGLAAKVPPPYFNPRPP